MVTGFCWVENILFQIGCTAQSIPFSWLYLCQPKRCTKEMHPILSCSSSGSGATKKRESCRHSDKSQRLREAHGSWWDKVGWKKGPILWHVCMDVVVPIKIGQLVIKLWIKRGNKKDRNKLFLVSLQFSKKYIHILGLLWHFFFFPWYFISDLFLGRRRDQLHGNSCVCLFRKVSV